MRWSRLLPRRRNPHTVLITGVKSAVRQGSASKIQKVLLTTRTQVGLGLLEAQELYLIIAGRMDNSMGHEEASSRLTALAASMAHQSKPATTWFSVENLSRTIGCFRASHEFSRHGFDALSRSDDPRSRFLGALHRRDLAAATAAWSDLSGYDSVEARDAGHYLWLWSRGQAGRPDWSSDSSWSKKISGQQVVILGPAPTSLKKSSLRQSSLVGRVVMQDVLAWDEERDPLGGRCELAWVSRETRMWIKETGAWDQLAPFDAVSFRVDRASQEWAEIGTKNFRAAHNPSSLMIGGSSPNMIPLMVWDVLKVDGASLSLGGTTFFASQTAYTETNRRLKHTMGKPTDETGSTGELFERCPTFARHNVTENLALVANLAEAGAIAVDAECQRVIELDVLDYLGELDELYGIERR
jgi:hypothetical protein